MKLLLIISLVITLAGYGKTARIVVADNEDNAVVIAAKDLQSDIAKITGKTPALLRSSRPKKGDVFISTRSDGRWEAYDVSSRDGVLRICGSDPRGTMFGIYDFCENYLGVDPFYFWNDSPLPKSETLLWDNVEIHSPGPTFRYRGFFVNDEDFLCAWKEPSGHRDNGYKYYDKVMPPELMDRILEAALRSRMNLIIPATLTNIFNPPEAALVDACARRGMFISQHHIEPLGVSNFTYNLYWKAKGGDIPFYSYYRNPDKLEEVWRESAKRWAKYPNVLWQIGLKGTGDHSIWEADPTIPEDDSVRAGIISSAMAAQARILDEIGVPREGRIMTNTLWADAAAFNARGLLSWPEGTTVVFSDNCPGWRWPEDFWNTERLPGRTYGVYYHPAVMIAGPHLASLVPVEKTYSCVGEAVGKSSSDYIVFNVANIREITCNLDAATKMVWDYSGFKPEEWQKTWVKRHYGTDSELWRSAYNIHYHATQTHPETGLPILFDGQMVRRIGKMNKHLAELLSNPGSATAQIEDIVNEGRSADVTDTWKKAISSVMGLEVLPDRETFKRLASQKAAFCISREYSLSLFNSLEDNGVRQFAYTTLVYPTSIMEDITAWMMELLHAQFCLERGDRSDAIAHIRKAVGAADDILDLAEEYCSGKWENWYRGCIKLDIYGERARSAALLEIK